MNAQHRRRGVRFAQRRHQIGEREARLRRQQLTSPNTEPIEAHDPEHATGCLRCFVARRERSS